MSDNTARVARAARSLEAYSELMDYDQEDEGYHVLITDLLTDLQHYARYSQVDFDKALQMSKINFEEEVQDDE